MSSEKEAKPAEYAKLKELRRVLTAKLAKLKEEELQIRHLLGRTNRYKDEEIYDEIDMLDKLTSTVQNDEMNDQELNSIDSISSDELERRLS